MKIQLWVEGYATTGQSGIAELLFETEAGSFDSAVEIYNKLHGLKITKTSCGEYLLWGCRVFDNRTEAQKQFG